MFTFKVTIDTTTAHASKPTNIAAVSSKLKEQMDVTIDDLTKLVTAPYSYTFSPGLFNGTRSNANWTGQSLFCLDFDNGISPESVMKRLNDLGINPNFIYNSFSDSPELRKFRVGFVMNTLVTDADVAKGITKGLIKLFPEADKSCRDYARLYFGGKSIMFLNEQEQDINQFIINLSTFMVSLDEKNTKRQLLPLQKVGENTVSIIDNNTLPVFPQKSGTRPSIIDKVDFEELAESILIFKDFMSGKRLRTNQIFGLATNLRFLNGGCLLMKKTMMKFNEESTDPYTAHNFAAIACANGYDYLPQALKNFSPYEETYYNMLEAASFVNGRVDILEEKTYISVDEAFEKLKAEFNAAMAAESGIFLFKCATGLGKTELLTSVTDAVIALPNNALKKEVFERMKVHSHITPDTPSFSKEMQEKLNFLYTAGLHDKAASAIRSVANGDTSVDFVFTATDTVMAKKYNDDNKALYKERGSIVTSHSKAMHVPYTRDTLIFDEDPREEFIKIGTITMNDISALQKGACEADIKAIMEWFVDAPMGQFEIMPKFRMNISKLADEVQALDFKSSRGGSPLLNANLFEFLTASHYSRDISNPSEIKYVTKCDLPNYKKIIILSASASDTMYEGLFPDIKIINIMDVENMGTINQYTKYSYSKSCLARRLNVLKNDNELAFDDIFDGFKEQDAVITFKDFKKHFKNPLPIHFYACSGFDDYKGKDVTVIGTPWYKPEDYFLLGLAIGLDLKTKDFATSHRPIEYDGKRFKFCTFVYNDKLMKLHLDIIISELIQAAGRGRLLRTDAVATVYSNMPLNQARYINK